MIFSYKLKVKLNYRPGKLKNGDIFNRCCKPLTMCINTIFELITLDCFILVISDRCCNKSLFLIKCRNRNLTGFLQNWSRMHVVNESNYVQKRSRLGQPCPGLLCVFVYCYNEFVVI